MSHKLLLADDSVTIQRVIELTFADEDVEVSAVGNGQQAIDRISAEPPDIVLADLGMPERDGYEVAAFVKDRPDLAHIPVILLTGAFEPVDEARAREVRCDGVLAKPFEPQLLISRVKELLARGTGASPEGEHAVSRVLPDAEALQTMPGGEAELTIDPAGMLESMPDRSSVADVSLYDYFDRLDQAFATLAGGGSRNARPAERPAPAAAFESVFTDAGANSGLHPASAASQPVSPGRTSMQSVAVPVADVFATMLEAEGLHPGAAAASVPAVLVAAQAPTEEMVEQVTRRVIERLTDRALREAVNDAVLAAAERLVREEIERLKGTPR